MMACPSHASGGDYDAHHLEKIFICLLEDVYLKPNDFLCVEGRHRAHGFIIFFSVIVTSLMKVCEGPVWPLSRNRMTISAAMQYKNVGHRSRIITALLGCSISFENI